MIDRESIVPPWQQLAGVLRERIRSGTLRPGARVPSVLSLAQEYDLAANTVRKALESLRAEGLIESRPGWGTFVREGTAKGKADPPG